MNLFNKEKTETKFEYIYMKQDVDLRFDLFENKLDKVSDDVREMKYKHHVYSSDLITKDEFMKLAKTNIEDSLTQISLIDSELKRIDSDLEHSVTLESLQKDINRRNEIMKERLGKTTTLLEQLQLVFLTEDKAIAESELDSLNYKIDRIKEKIEVKEDV